jgi:hypothetical protein
LGIAKRADLKPLRTMIDEAHTILESNLKDNVWTIAELVA